MIYQHPMTDIVRQFDCNVSATLLHVIISQTHSIYLPDQVYSVYGVNVLFIVFALFFFFVCLFFLQLYL